MQTLTTLQIALGRGGPLPLANSLREEIALVRLAEPRGPLPEKPQDCGACKGILNLPEHDLPPTARRSQKEIARVLDLLDSLEPAPEGQLYV